MAKQTFHLLSCISAVDMYFQYLDQKAAAMLKPDPLGFPDSSVGKTSACNSGDPGSIPGLERSPGEGIGYPLQYSWDSFVA